MATTRERIEPEARNLVIYTKIDFGAKEVVECKSTSSIFRGYSVFMKGKDPRDAGFITSRICGICGDNHAVCANYAQNMAFGITNPALADIMRAFNPFEGEIYKEALHFSRVTREMFCLMEGRHVHPSTIYPGGTGTVPTPQVFTDYLVRLMRCLDFIKRGVPMNDDVFNFFYEALPGYHEVGLRRTLLGCWGSFQDPTVCDYDYRHMEEGGRGMFVTPGVVVD